jgi:rfaE bifunctional protein kinase chain/domain
MIDRYWYGDVTRLSQEAPVPVVRFQKEDRRAGAAANVALNCQAMGAETTLLSAIGGDETSFTFEAMVKNGLFLHHTHGTTQKLRVIGKQQQIARIDFDYHTPEAYSAKIEGKFQSMVQDYDIIILSDYGKGVLNHVARMISVARSFGKVVLVDPKGHNYSKYRGATLIKPNIDEIREMVGGWDSESELKDKVEEFIEDGGFDAVLLTRASEGMTLFRKDCQPYHVKSEARSVFDVTGAGDVVISAFAVSLARGLDWNQATNYASKASGLSVERFGTVAITEAEVF